MFLSNVPHIYFFPGVFVFFKRRFYPLFVSIIIFSGGPVLSVTVAFHEGFTHNICRKTKELPKFDPDNGEVTGDFFGFHTWGP